MPDWRGRRCGNLEPDQTAVATNGPDARFTTWLYIIAGDLARNRDRWRSRHPNVSLDAPSNHASPNLAEVLPGVNVSPGEAAATEERWKAERVAARALPADLRGAVILWEWRILRVLPFASRGSCASQPAQAEHEERRHRLAEP